MKGQVIEMALSYERSTSLAFDTDALRKYGDEYRKIADDLRVMANKLDNCLSELSNSGWTTPAGQEFEKLVKTNWSENIEKYAALLDTLRNILYSAADEYDDLVVNHIEKTKLT